MELDVVHIECDIQTCTSKSFVNALYGALRTFESEFRKLTCHDCSKSCSSCLKQEECSYRKVFAQCLSSNPDIIKIHQKPSLPFSLSIRAMNVNISTCTLGLVVVGHVINYLNIFHSALLNMITSTMNHNFSASLCSLQFYFLDYYGTRFFINDAEFLSKQLIMLSGQHILQNSVHANTVKITLYSPLTIVSNRSVVHQFDFGIFFRSQLRRCSSLFAYYGTGALELDFIGLSDKANNVALLENEIRYINHRISNHLAGSGLIGMADCSGLVEPMFSLLLLGSYFNAGKGASYGAGFYQLEAM